MSSSLFGGAGQGSMLRNRLSSGSGGSGSSGGKMSKAPAGFERVQQFTPEQMNLFKQMFGNVGPDSFTAKLAGGDQSTFDQLEAPALRQFAGLQGQTASRFSGMGSGARKSSGFQNTMTAGSSQFAQDLASQRMGLQQQALKDLFGMSESLLGQRPYGMVEKPMSFGQSLAGGLAGGLGAGIGKSLFGGLFG